MRMMKRGIRREEKEGTTVIGEGIRKIKFRNGGRIVWNLCAYLLTLPRPCCYLLKLPHATQIFSALTSSLSSTT